MRPCLPGQRLCSMDSYKTRGPCENVMFTNNSKAFMNLSYFLYERVLSFTTRNRKARKGI